MQFHLKGENPGVELLLAKAGFQMRDALFPYLKLQGRLPIVVVASEATEAG